MFILLKKSLLRTDSYNEDQVVITANQSLKLLFLPVPGPPLSHSFSLRPRGSPEGGGYMLSEQSWLAHNTFKMTGAELRYTLYFTNISWIISTSTNKLHQIINHSNCLKQHYILYQSSMYSATVYTYSTIEKEWGIKWVRKIIWFASNI